jgi:FkbM family methyltransferase
MAFVTFDTRKSQVSALSKQGRVVESVKLLHEWANDNRQNREEMLFAGVFLIENGHYSHYREAKRYLEAFLDLGGSDIAAYENLGTACWGLEEHAKSIAYSQKAIALDPKRSPAYRTLAMLYLTTQHPFEAFTIASAGILNAEPKKFLYPWLDLAKALMCGVKEAVVDFEGMKFVFQLVCFNGQAMEECSYHLRGSLYEEDELRYLKGAISSSKTIVECGCLAGNHTLFFAKAWGPEKITVFDMDIRSINQTRENFEINRRLDGFSTVLDLRHAAVGRTIRELDILGQKVRQVTIDSEVTEPFDFLKMDVDGAEMDALTGAEECIRKYRPRMMVEVIDSNRPAFLELLAKWGYRVQHAFVRAEETNFIVVPVTTTPV